MPPAVTSVGFVTAAWDVANKVCATVSGKNHCWNTTNSSYGSLAVVYLGECDAAGNFCGDADQDGVIDTNDKFPANAAAAVDTDLDGMPDAWIQPNPFSCAADAVTCNGLVLDTDDDADGVEDAVDNCVLTSNTDQLDTDGDGQGNACDSDDDNDGVADGSDACPLDATASSSNTDGDSLCNQSDPDDDNDGALDGSDNCPLNSNANQLNTDGDGQGDVCDLDDDNDGVLDASDKFPLDATESADFDNDGVGNNGDLDDDNDGALDTADNCPLVANSDQGDEDGDGIGNICDSDGAGKLDIAFNPGTGASYSVYSVAIQADGKTLIGGDFTSYNGTAINRIARLNSDGSLDASFNPGTGASSEIYAIALQADGKVLIAGDFTVYNGTVISRIARLNSDGSLDTSFNPGTVADGGVNSVVIQADGKVLIGGFFSAYHGIARLNSDGSMDTSFNPGMGPDAVDFVAHIYSVAIQADGKVLIGGGFTSYNGTARNYIARLNSDGSLDTSFDSGTGVNNDVRVVAIQPDGKVLVGGSFISYQITRLNSDGSRDTAFNPSTTINYGIYSIAMQADGKLLVGGGASRIVSRLNSDGSFDTDFSRGIGVNVNVSSVAIQADGKALIGGYFTAYNGTAINRIARIHTGDADQDGIENAADYFSNNAAAAVDTDHDGKPDAWLQPNAFGCAVDAATCNGLTLDNNNPVVDTDNDGIDDNTDNCVAVSNVDQLNADADTEGNACDVDDDNDGVIDIFDAFPFDATESVDTDGDGIGDNADPTPNGDIDSDSDGITDNVDICPSQGDQGYGIDANGCPNPPPADEDGDGVEDSIDNCVSISNADQLNADGDAQGDACDVLPDNPDVLLEKTGAAKGEQLGSSVALADMDNDGVVDLLVGSPMANISADGKVLKKAGQIQIISGKNNTVIKTINGTSANQQLGTAIAVVPDQNKDGVLDIAVGDPLADVKKLMPNGFSTLKDAGRVLLYSGSDSRMWILAEGEHAGDHFGSALTAADVNGDSKVDLIVGAPMSDAAAKDAGQVAVFNGISHKLLYTRNGTQADEHFGAAVAAANGHLFAGSPQFDVTAVKDAGRVSVFNNSEGVSAALLTADGAAKGDSFGAAIAAVNDDWVVGIPLADSAGKDAGSVKFFSGLNATSTRTLNGATAGDNFGSALNMQGDVNQDGMNDIAIGVAKFDANAIKDVGRVQVLSGAEL
ncbi:MAG TPA: thrombospondin type 3 repeat-containing protein [Pseudomonadales bacterium]|nr:thrombospondin type 3 repeat-containing protein [Pseudomonadales bacterium]